MARRQQRRFEAVVRAAGLPIDGNGESKTRSTLAELTRTASLLGAHDE